MYIMFVILCFLVQLFEPQLGALQISVIIIISIFNTFNKEVCFKQIPNNCSLTLNQNEAQSAPAESTHKGVNRRSKAVT